MAIQIGQRLGPYEVLSAIGAGGTGEVYQAHDTKLGRDVAIKVLPCSDQGSTGQSEHLISEDSSILRQGCCGRRKSGLVDAFESVNCSKPAEGLRGKHRGTNMGYFPLGSLAGHSCPCSTQELAFGD
jgi:serine/threonine protein kinase